MTHLDLQMKYVCISVCHWCSPCLLIFKLKFAILDRKWNSNENTVSFINHAPSHFFSNFAADLSTVHNIISFHYLLSYKTTLLLFSKYCTHVQPFSRNVICSWFKHITDCSQPGKRKQCCNWLKGLWWHHVTTVKQVPKAAKLTNFIAEANNLWHAIMKFALFSMQ